jgi:hypothetical protein
MTSDLSNNLVITKTWQDSVEPFFSIRVRAVSAIAEVIHDCSYTNVQAFLSNVRTLLDCVDRYPCEQSVFLTLLGSSPGSSFLPGVVLRLLPRDSLGHIYIEVDLPIMDISDGTHRAKFFIESELGQTERFIKRLSNLPDKDVGFFVELRETE